MGIFVSEPNIEVENCRFELAFHYFYHMSCDYRMEKFSTLKKQNLGVKVLVSSPCIFIQNIKTLRVLLTSVLSTHSLRIIN